MRVKIDCLDVWTRRVGADPRVCPNNNEQPAAHTSPNSRADRLLPSFGGDWGDWGLQSSHRRGCGPTKGSESLIRDGGL